MLSVSRIFEAASSALIARRPNFTPQVVAHGKFERAHGLSNYHRRFSFSEMEPFRRPSVDRRAHAWLARLRALHVDEKSLPECAREGCTRLYADPQVRGNMLPDAYPVHFGVQPAGLGAPVSFPPSHGVRQL
jgi:hypothetical protein